MIIFFSSGAVEADLINHETWCTYGGEREDYKLMECDSRYIGI